MKKAILYFILVAGFVASFSGCKMNEEDPKSKEVSLVPVIAFQSTGEARVITQPYGDGSNAALNRASGAFYLFAPIITGFSDNTSGATVGGSYSVSFMGTSITFNISEEASGEILFDGTFADGSGWLKTWYNPAAHSFKFEQLLFIDDADMYISNSGSPMRLVLYKRTGDILFGDDVSHYFGNMDSFNYMSDGTLAETSAQGSNSFELFAGAMSTATTGVGASMYSMFDPSSSDYTSVAYAPPAIAVGTLSDFTANKDAVYAYLKLLADSDTLVETAGYSGGFAYDPAITAAPFLEMNGDGAGSLDIDADGTVEAGEFRTKLALISSEWATKTTLVP